MIKVEMHGRLGNQLFQYAAARALKEKTGQDMVFSFRQVNGANTEGNNGWENSLKYFKTEKYSIYPDNKLLLNSMPWNIKGLCTLYATAYRPYMNDMKKWYEFQLKWCPILDKNGVRWIANGFYNFKNDKCTDFLLNGSFESPEYFHSVKDILRNEIVPIEEEMEKNKELYDIIRQSNSVCLSVRHFQLSGREANMYDTCNKNYYETAIKQIKKKFSNPLFVVFSDDIEWVKSVLDFSGLNVVFETEGNPLWEKLRLMYSCKHFIIPNSTFAWWAQYLGRNPNKTVVSPAFWFNEEYDSSLIDNIWLRIDKNGDVFE